MGMVMHGQNLGQQESIGWQLNTINYAALAQGFCGHADEPGLRVIRVNYDVIHSMQCNKDIRYGLPSGS